MDGGHGGRETRLSRAWGRAPARAPPRGGRGGGGRQGGGGRTRRAGFHFSACLKLFWRSLAKIVCPADVTAPPRASPLNVKTPHGYAAYAAATRHIIGTGEKPGTRHIAQIVSCPVVLPQQLHTRARIAHRRGLRTARLQSAASCLLINGSAPHRCWVHLRPAIIACWPRWHPAAPASWRR